MPSKPVTVDIPVGDTTITLESGEMALQAGGSVLVRHGDTVLFSASTAAKGPREGIDFFPLQVEYREKYYAAGRFPGGYFKREARPSDKEVLTARFTDRPLRPLFPKGYINEVQVINHLLSVDGVHAPDALSIIGASASLTLSDIPFMGPVGAVRIGRVNGEFVINPTPDQAAESDLDLLYAGGRELPIMIEGSAKEISEADMVAAMRLAHATIQPIIDAQLELRRLRGLPEKVVTEEKGDTCLLDKARELVGAELSDALAIAGKQERQARLDEIKAKAKTALAEAFPDADGKAIGNAWGDLEIEITRRNVVERGQRIGGRGMEELRELAGRVDVLPRTHGSALFSRGETQALATVTLGTLSDAQSLDAISGGPSAKRFMLHYNFPHFSVGETGRLMGTGRREIGHGALAERSLEVMMPEDYAYTVRLVSEIMGSNGSSSMASICVGSMALMAAGVPMKAAVGGISIGLFTDDSGKAQLVTDILGTEDHCGDMDFKVAGTRKGITGFQVDLKLRGLKWEYVEDAFRMAREARAKILDFMDSVIPEPRAETSPHAPRIETVKINPSKIGMIIGPGGKNIRRLEESYHVQIDIEEDGSIHLFSTDREGMAAAVEDIKLTTAEPEVGATYEGTVKGIKEFGAFVEILPGQEGLVHISELDHRRVRAVEDICQMGDKMTVKVLNVDRDGKIRLSRKALLPELQPGEEGYEPPRPEGEGDADRGERRPFRGGGRSGEGGGERRRGGFRRRD